MKRHAERAAVGAGTSDPGDVSKRPFPHRSPPGPADPPLMTARKQDGDSGKHSPSIQTRNKTIGAKGPVVTRVPSTFVDRGQNAPGTTPGTTPNSTISSSEISPNVDNLYRQHPVVGQDQTSGSMKDTALPASEEHPDIPGLTAAPASREASNAPPVGRASAAARRKSEVIAGDSGGSDEDGTDAGQDRKRRRGEIEKKRRDRINSCLEDLKRLVPEASRKGNTKLEKAEILTMTVDFVHKLTAEGFEPQEALAQEYRLRGYRECVMDTLRYLAHQEHFSDEQQKKLQQHLDIQSQSCAGPAKPHVPGYAPSPQMGRPAPGPDSSQFKPVETPPGRYAGESRPPMELPIPRHSMHPAQSFGSTPQSPVRSPCPANLTLQSPFIQTPSSLLSPAKSNPSPKPRPQPFPQMKLPGSSAQGHGPGPLGPTPFDGGLSNGRAAHSAHGPYGPLSFGSTFDGGTNSPRPEEPAQMPMISPGFSPMEPSYPTPGGSTPRQLQHSPLESFNFPNTNQVAMAQLAEESSKVPPLYGHQSASQAQRGHHPTQAQKQPSFPSLQLQQQQQHTQQQLRVPARQQGQYQVSLSPCTQHPMQQQPQQQQRRTAQQPHMQDSAQGIPHSAQPRKPEVKQEVSSPMKAPGSLLPSTNKQQQRQQHQQSQPQQQVWSTPAQFRN